MKKLITQLTRLDVFRVNTALREEDDITTDEWDKLHVITNLSMAVPNPAVSGEAWWRHELGTKVRANQRSSGWDSHTLGNSRSQHENVCGD